VTLVIPAGTVNVPNVPVPYCGFVAVVDVCGSVIAVVEKPADNPATDTPVFVLELI